MPRIERRKMAPNVAKARVLTQPPLEHSARTRRNLDMTSFRPWLLPTLLGPLLTMWGLATFLSMLIGAAAATNGTVDTWAVLMMYATLIGSAIGVITVGIDVTLLKLKWRCLPTGGRAWLASMLTPLLVYMLWTQLWWLPQTEVGVVMFIMLPMVGCSFGTRMVFGTRP